MAPSAQAHINGSARRGFGLVEALASVLLLSLCALAYASLQMRGLAANTSAMWRSKAAVLGYEMADRMRANRAGVQAGAYDNFAAAVAAPGCGSVSSCTPAQMAALDYTQWSASIGAALPGGTGVVCLDATPDDGTAASPACDGAGSTFAVKLFWTEHGVASRLVVAVRP
jgi:type IV pilus assembly protein PilV